ncbi:Phospholipid-transporting ATPase abca1, partial [Sarracenia purpurea var. burkii]
LKGASKEQATTEAEEYLKMTGLASKKNSKVNELSGGMIRKLCLSIAMMGKAEVLILDEPSSGMDTEARRSLWDLLLSGDVSTAKDPKSPKLFSTVVILPTIFLCLIVRLSLDDSSSSLSQPVNLSLSNIPNGTVIYEEVKPAVSFGEQVAKYVAEKGGVFMKGNGSGMETKRMDGFYHIQMMSRLSPFVYWLGTLLFDFTLFAIAMIMRMALFKMIGSMAIIGFHEAFSVHYTVTPYVTEEKNFTCGGVDTSRNTGLIRFTNYALQYLAVAGYCAQTNCFIEQLTGLEMLTIIASLRGVQAQDRRKLVNKWISIIGLEEYKNRRCGSYSGGNKRKLCSAMSLIGDPHVVFLDEPTSGVDPVSRRNLYDVMAQSKASGQTVVLTSHSMEECETLCDRLTIMENKPSPTNCYGFDCWESQFSIVSRVEIVEIMNRYREKAWNYYLEQNATNLLKNCSRNNFISRVFTTIGDDEGPKDSQLTDATRLQILQLLNDARNKIAKGDCSAEECSYPCKGCNVNVQYCNMVNVQWHWYLERKASEVVRNCPTKNRVEIELEYDDDPSQTSYDEVTVIFDLPFYEGQLALPKTFMKLFWMNAFGDWTDDEADSISFPVSEPKEETLPPEIKTTTNTTQKPEPITAPTVKKTPVRKTSTEDDFFKDDSEMEPASPTKTIGVIQVPSMRMFTGRPPKERKPPKRAKGTELPPLFKAKK